MIRPTRFDLFLSLPLGLFMAGCAGMGRTELGPRTTPSVGDRQLGVISGRPGEESLVRSDSVNSSIVTVDDRRISGRVIDHRGQPVSGATVRLADGALSGGMVSDVVTDEAGGFTIRGLRNSTPYTVIATLELGSETRIARARFLSGETQARILIEPNARGDEFAESPVRRNRPNDSSVADRSARQTNQSEPLLPSTQAEKPPVGKWVYVLEDGSEAEVVSNQSATESKEQFRRVSYRPEQLEKIEETAETAVNERSNASRPETSVQAERGQKPNQNASQWRSKSTRAADAESGDVTVSLRDVEVRRSQYIDEDGENPLPPAIERKAFVYEEFRESATIDKIARMDELPDASPRSRNRYNDNRDDDLVPVRPIARPAEEVLAEEFDDQSVPPVSRSPRVAGSRSPAQPVYVDSPRAGSLRVEDIEEANRIRRAQRSGQSVQNLNVNNQRDQEPSPRRTTTWEQAERPRVAEEIARTDRTISRTNRSVNSLMGPDDLPLDRDEEPIYMSGSRGLERPVSRRDEIERSLSRSERSSMLSQIEPEVARTDQERIDRLRNDQDSNSSAFHGDSPRTSNEWLNRMTGSLAFWKKPSEPTSDDIRTAFCEFDAQNQRILDFELQNVKGKSVRLSQMPSELTLLFFWGTWCKPCHEAMPHLIELQKQLAADNVQVVGIAYEEGTNAERQKKVAMAADRYGINFPLLMGGSGGAENCPVRKALDVRVYPTMVLLDRDGRVLWKDQGVTPSSLGRLDKALASHLQQLDIQQYARSENGRLSR
jgi:thiol-disulfide isomerase/thioredoxin